MRCKACFVHHHLRNSCFLCEKSTSFLKLKMVKRVRAKGNIRGGCAQDAAGWKSGAEIGSDSLVMRI